jgi:hypothetical protein
MKSASTLIALVIVTLMAVGCASLNTMPPDVDAKVKALQPPAGKALVYVVRPTSLGKPFEGTITANGEYIGTTQGTLYVYAVLDPGEYKFKASGQDNESEIDVTLEAGKTCYIYQSVYPAVFKGAVRLSVVDEKEGRQALGECVLSGKLGKYSAQ